MRNVNGLGSKIKRGLILKALGRYRPDIVFLQETHMINKQHDRLERGKYRVAYYEQYTSGSRGVLLLVKKPLAFQITRTWADGLGCYAAVQRQWEGETMVFLTV